MPPLNATALRQQLASGDTAPLYMLVGTDPVERSAVAGEFADIVEEDLRPFNVERLYGGEARVDDLIDSARTLPMMAPRRVVIVGDADKLLIPKRESAAAEAELERLEMFIQNAPSHATIVFVCGQLDMRRRVVKLLLKLAQVVDCGTIESEADAERWVKARAAREGITMEPAAVKALVERVGLDLTRLRAGLERVSLYAMGQPAISAFSSFSFESEPTVEAVTLDNLRGTSVLEAPEDLAAYANAYDQLRSAALAPDASMRLIRSALRSSKEDAS